MANENSISLGAATANRWLTKNNFDPTIFDYMYFGITIAQHHLFYSHTWAAALLVNGAKDPMAHILSGHSPLDQVEKWSQKTG
jgi:hypothetical protein